MFLNPRFKMTTSFVNIARMQLAPGNLYTRKEFKSSGIGSLYEKLFLILNGLKTSLMLKFPLQNSLPSFESLFLIWCERLLIYDNSK